MLFPLRDYMKQALHLVRNNSYNLSKQVFLSTEDEKVVHDALQETGWTIIYANVSRPNMGTQGLKDMKGPRQEMIESLFSLSMALEADAFIGTLSSNWCRLIDELRDTVAAKASVPLVSLSSGSGRRDSPCATEYPACYLDW